jgi:phosphohistidine swiveling domain-containing protein
MAASPENLFVPGKQSVPHHAAQNLGGKAAGLLRLRGLSLAVPDFVVLPAALFEPATTGLPLTDVGLLARRDALSQFEIPASVQQQLRQTLAAWDFPAAPVAVRSSVADEDGATAAFPGLMDSVLNVTDWFTLMAAVARVAASAYSDRALAYRRQRGLPLAARPAVIIQRQVAARAAGVMFTTFPEYPQEVAIHAVPGLAEGLVSGQLEPDEFYLCKATGQLVAVTERSSSLATVSPAEDEPTPDHLQLDEALLAPDTLAELWQISQLLEKELRGPQDVEFAQDQAGKLWLVQARPITQPVPEVLVFDNANIQESYCGVTTPLTFSFARRAYATVYRQTMRTLGLPAVTVAAHETVITNLLALVQGRVYYNLNNWYRGLLLLPKFSQSKTDMERMMGVLEPIDFVENHQKSWSEKLRLLPRLALNLTQLLWSFQQLPKQVAAFQARFAAEYARFYELNLKQLPVPELLAALSRLDATLLKQWTTPIINDFRVMMTNGAAGRLLTAAGIADTDEFLSRYLSAGAEAGESSGAESQPLASMLPALALQELARVLLTQFPALRPLVLALPPDLPRQVRQLAPAFEVQVQAYISRYGDRSIGELKLETDTMRTNELLIYKYLRNFLAADQPGASAPAARLSSLHQEAAAELAMRLRHVSGGQARRTWAGLRKLRAAVARRELLRLERTRLFGMYRGLYRELGQRLAAAGTLSAALDVFYLTEAEIEEAVRKGGPEWAALVAQRQAEFAGYRQTTAPPGRVVQPARPTGIVAAETGTLRGTGCYPGRVSAEVVVIADPGEASFDVSGRIVAALRTDPGWAALFPTCRGVLIERGSALSHSVILLRELGIPTIINVPGLTERLRSGQVITMDGTTGEVLEQV